MHTMKSRQRRRRPSQEEHGSLQRERLSRDHRAQRRQRDAECSRRLSMRGRNVINGAANELRETLICNACRLDSIDFAFRLPQFVAHKSRSEKLDLLKRWSEGRRDLIDDRSVLCVFVGAP